MLCCGDLCEIICEVSSQKNTLQIAFFFRSINQWQKSNFQIPIFCCNLKREDPRPQFYVKLVYKATLSFTLKSENLSGSLLWPQKKFKEKFIKELLCNFLVQKLQYENLKKPPSSWSEVLIFFITAQKAQTEEFMLQNKMWLIDQLYIKLGPRLSLFFNLRQKNI